MFYTDGTGHVIRREVANRPGAPVVTPVPVGMGLISLIRTAPRISVSPRPIPQASVVPASDFVPSARQGRA